MIFQLLPPNDPRWRDRVVSWESDVYHLPEYGLAASDAGEDVRAAVVSQGNRSLLMPLIVRGIPAASGLSDAISPYGYPGPLLSPMEKDARDEFLAEAIPSLVSGLAAAGIVAAFIRMHPFVGLQPVDIEAFGTTVHHGETVIIDLAQSEDDLWSQTRKGHRYEINRSRKLGHRAFLDSEWQHFDQFLEIYSETMGRVEATSSYLFGREYFVALREALGDYLHLWVVEIDGDIAAASLFTEFNGIVQYHLSGTRTQFLRAQPNKLLLHEVRSWAKKRDNRVMHLGGGVGAARDSLFAFKAGFSKQMRSFHTWRLITDRDAHDDLVRQRGMDPSELNPSGYFPAYRLPLT